MRPSAFLLVMALAVALVTPAHAQPVARTVLDPDDDGATTADEVTDGGNPLYARSAPGTDDDGDGQSNDDEVESIADTGLGPRVVRTVTHNSATYPGTYGVSIGRSGYAQPDGFSPMPVKGDASLDRVLLNDDGIWVWDAVCLPALIASYDACQGEQNGNNRDASAEIYSAGELAMDGYGWKRLASWDLPEAEQTFILPVPCAGTGRGDAVCEGILTVTVAATGVPVVSLDHVQVTYEDGPVVVSDDTEPDAVRDPDVRMPQKVKDLLP